MLLTAAFAWAIVVAALALLLAVLKALGPPLVMYVIAPALALLIASAALGRLFPDTRLGRFWNSGDACQRCGAPAEVAGQMLLTRTGTRCRDKQACAQRSGTG